MALDTTEKEPSGATSVAGLVVWSRFAGPRRWMDSDQHPSVRPAALCVLGVDDGLVRDVYLALSGAGRLVRPTPAGAE